MTPVMPDPDRDVLILIGDAARLIRTEADRRARRLELTRAQWVILARVERTPGLSQRELAELLEVEPITVGRLVDRLEARGLVERRPVPGDRRVWRLHLCPAAIPVLEELELEKTELAELALAGLDPALRESLVTALAHVKQNMGACRREAAATLKATG